MSGFDASAACVALLKRLIAFDTTSERSNLPLIQWFADIAEEIDPELLVMIHPLFLGAPEDTLINDGVYAFLEAGSYDRTDDNVAVGLSVGF
ncbi:hypothetical protein [Halomonas kalidii]|uniref:Uncharacterized protein n=1 Tax=Halomonas kalidii TaxID=3043293 RepID=A0ABT6VLX6_9GAMM|nr:hypothetical protein [Halomonas kalidii]MDI5934974.1 hypothetical protein [Halomonas kalidii]